jgi:hypothetical protein
MAVRVDRVMNPFHGTHHDYRFAARLGQRELAAAACEESVTIEIADLRSQRIVISRSIGPAELRPPNRSGTLARLLIEFVEAATTILYGPEMGMALGPADRPAAAQLRAGVAARRADYTSWVLGRTEPMWVVIGY